MAVLVKMLLVLVHAQTVERISVLRVLRAVLAQHVMALRHQRVVGGAVGQLGLANGEEVMGALGAQVTGVGLQAFEDLASDFSVELLIATKLNVV